MLMARNLANLGKITFRMHTAGVTTSAFTERQMIAMEAVDPMRAKGRRVMALQDVVAKYELATLLDCRSLTVIRIEYIDCEMTAHFTRVGSPSNVLRALQMWLIRQFAQMGRNIHVELTRAN